MANECQSRKEQTVEVNFPLKVRVMEDLHGDFLLAVVLLPELWVVDGDVLLEVFAGHEDLGIPASAVHAGYSPVCNSDRNAGNDEEEEVGLEATAVYNGEDTFDEPWNTNNENCELGVREVAITLCQTDEGGIFYGRDIGDAHWSKGHGWW